MFRNLIHSAKAAAVLGLVLAAATAHAQSHYRYGVTPAQALPPAAVPPVLVAPVPPPAALPPAAPDGCAGGCCPTHKVCVVEPKEKTKILYCTRHKEFCIKTCGWFGFGKCNSCGCDDGCCEMRTRKVLIWKTVPDCPDTKCVLKEVPVECAPAPCPAPCDVAPVPGTKHH